MRHPNVRVPFALTAALAVSLAGCGDSLGVPGSESVALNFRVGGAAAPATASGGPQMVAGPPLTLDGVNGSLTLDEILLIVSEVELEPEDGSCDSDSSRDDDCSDWEAPPRFLDLPLDGEPVPAVTALIPPGVYDELEFEIEDLEDDEDDEAERAAIEALRTEILAVVPDWPREASVAVTGSFTPTGGSAIAFRVFIEAEIEVEMELVPSLVVGEDGVTSRDLTVDVLPEVWFLRPDGTVLPLHLYDYDQTGELLELEVELEDGFTEVEIG